MRWMSSSKPVTSPRAMARFVVALTRSFRKSSGVRVRCRSFSTVRAAAGRVYAPIRMRLNTAGDSMRSAAHWGNDRPASDDAEFGRNGWTGARIDGARGHSTRGHR